jgi:SAM-dependent methyltransferase
MSRFENLDWYDTPRYYDMVFAPGTEAEANFLEQAHLRYGKTRGRRLLEPACGSGRMVAEMARRSWKVTGFDLSDSMLEFARQRLTRSSLKARVDRGQLEAFEYPERFDLAHCLVSTFKYVLDAAGARSHLACVARALKPGGIYVLGLHLSDYKKSSVARERWVESRGKTRVVCNTQTWPPDRRLRRERVRTRLVVTEGDREQRSQTEWWFRTYDARQLQKLIASVPELELVAVHDFLYEMDWIGSLDGGHDDPVLILRRS